MDGIAEDRLLSCQRFAVILATLRCLFGGCLVLFRFAKTSLLSSLPLRPLLWHRDSVETMDRAEDFTLLHFGCAAVGLDGLEPRATS